MKRSGTSFLVSAFVGLSAVCVAATAPVLEAFGPTFSQLDIEDTRQDADQLFDRIDANDDGFLSIDEYASQAVVRASLARFNGAVVVEGAQIFNIGIPEGKSRELSRTEQTAIDALARYEFYQVSGDDRILDRSEWIATRLDRFADADFDNNGKLRGAELDFYALRIAKHRTTMS